MAPNEPIPALGAWISLENATLSLYFLAGKAAWLPNAEYCVLMIGKVKVTSLFLWLKVQVWSQSSDRTEDMVH